MAEPPLFTLGEFKARITLDDVLDANEALDLKDALSRKDDR